jgi:hypothetical protein
MDDAALVYIQPEAFAFRNEGAPARLSVGGSLVSLDKRDFAMPEGIEMA